MNLFNIRVSLLFILAVHFILTYQKRKDVSYYDRYSIDYYNEFRRS